MEINQEILDQLKAFVGTVANAFGEIIKSIQKWFQENWKWVKEATIKWYQLEEKKVKVVRQHHKRDFSRQKISHQVIDRKPRHMVRKIIRR